MEKDFFSWCGEIPVASDNELILGLILKPPTARISWIGMNDAEMYT